MHGRTKFASFVGLYVFVIDSKQPHFLAFGKIFLLPLKTNENKFEIRFMPLRMQLMPILLLLMPNLMHRMPPMLKFASETCENRFEFI